MEVGLGGASYGAIRRVATQDLRSRIACGVQ